MDDDSPYLISMPLIISAKSSRSTDKAASRDKKFSFIVPGGENDENGKIMKPIRLPQSSHWLNIPKEEGLNTTKRTPIASAALGEIKGIFIKILAFSHCSRT